MKKSSNNFLSKRLFLQEDRTFTFSQFTKDCIPVMIVSTLQLQATSYHITYSHTFHSFEFIHLFIHSFVRSFIHSFILSLSFLYPFGIFLFFPSFFLFSFLYFFLTFLLSFVLSFFFSFFLSSTPFHSDFN